MSRPAEHPVGWRERLRRRRLVARTHQHLLPPSPDRFAAFGQRSHLVPPIRIWGAQYVEVGDDVTLMENGFVSCVPGPDGAPPRLVVGDRTSISPGFTIAVVREVVIGADVMMAARVFVGDASHAFEDPHRPIADQGMTPGRPVSIGDGAFVGIGSSILPGARIGRGAMVGAGSVVTGEVPDHTLVVGNPARVVRRYVEGRGWVRADGP